MIDRRSNDLGEPRRLGLIVNPIAGMGGRVGLKGTDDVAARAIELGAEPTAAERAREMLGELDRLLGVASPPIPIRWLTCAGSMGAEHLLSTGFEDYSILHEPSPVTTAEDAGAAVEAMVGAQTELIVFCGGDGTARDVCRITDMATPILGIPAGVKMYSGVFGVTPTRTAQILVALPAGRPGPGHGRGPRHRRGALPARRVVGPALRHRPHPVRTEPDPGDQGAAHRGR